MTATQSRTQSSSTGVNARGSFAVVARRDATRMFEEIRSESTSIEEAVTRVTALMDRVEQGPAPTGFKRAFVSTLDALVEQVMDA